MLAEKPKKKKKKKKKDAGEVHGSCLYSVSFSQLDSLYGAKLGP